MDILPLFGFVDFDWFLSFFSGLKMDEMESIRIENELEKQQPFSVVAIRGAEMNRDSGVADVLDDSKSNSSATSSSPDPAINAVKRAAVLSNSLLDMTDQLTLKRKKNALHLFTHSFDWLIVRKSLPFFHRLIDWLIDRLIERCTDLYCHHSLNCFFLHRRCSSDETL